MSGGPENIANIANIATNAAVEAGRPALSVSAAGGSIAKGAMFKPGIISVFFHFVVVLAVTVVGFGSARNFEAQAPEPIEITIEDPGLLDEAIEGAADEEEATENQEKAKEEELVTREEIIIPDDAKIVHERVASRNPTPESQTPAVLPRPLPAVPQPPTPALSNSAAKALALTRLLEQNAAFDPEGKAKPEDTTADLNRANAGQTSESDAASLAVESQQKATQRTALDFKADGFVFLPGGGDIPVPSSKPSDSAERVARLNEVLEVEEQAKEEQATKKGAEVVTTSDDKSVSDEGEDTENTPDKEEPAEEVKKAKKTPIPKPKPRRLAKAFESERDQERVAAAQVLQQQREEERKQLEALAAAQQPAEPEPETQPVVQPVPQTPQNQQRLDQLMADVLSPTPVQEVPVPQPIPVAQAPQTAPTSGAAAAPSLTQNEIQRISQKIENAWVVPAGITVRTAPVIRVTVELAPDGSVNSAQVMNFARMQTDPIYRAAAESALRAIRLSSPWDKPSGPYETWRSMTLTYDLKDFL